jgi:ADP-ribose pyrophosphatase
MHVDTKNWERTIMSRQSELRTLYTGRHLSLVAHGSWEFVSRNTRRPAVGIVAITDDDRVVLVEQYRPPVGQNVIELPAGLAGDQAGDENESLLDAARRELLEETGYTAARWVELEFGCSSPGLTDESIALFLAEGLAKQGPGGGDASEAITIHEVPFDDVLGWLAERKAMADLKLLAGLYAAQDHRRRRMPEKA